MPQSASTAEVGERRRQTETTTIADHIPLRAAAFAATFAAAWLAARVSNRGALSGERKLTPSVDPLPSAVRAAAHVVSSASYPIVYLPVAASIASSLQKQGVDGAEAVPRSAVFAWLTYHAVKSLTRRERPPSQQGEANDDRSYPSGHATAAAAIATSSAYLLLRHDHIRWSDVVPLALGVPIAIGASRIALGKHWPTDVLGGFATGVAVGALTTANRGPHADGNGRRIAG
jgi:hypothetical protein